MNLNWNRLRIQKKLATARHDGAKIGRLGKKIIAFSQNNPDNAFMKSLANRVSAGYYLSPKQRWFALKALGYERGQISKSLFRDRGKYRK